MADSKELRVMTAVTGHGVPATLNLSDAAMSPGKRRRLENLVSKMEEEDVGGLATGWWHMALSTSAYPDGVLMPPEQLLDMVHKINSLLSVRKL